MRPGTYDMGKVRGESALRVDLGVACGWILLALVRRAGPG